MEVIGDIIAAVLAFFYGIWNNYAFSIIALTLVVMLAFTPLVFSSTRSMMQMQRYQPEIKKLQAKYAGDRQRMNEEMMAFYRANNINPAGACLPLLIQMPIFIILFQVLRGLTRRTTEIGMSLGDAIGQITATSITDPGVNAMTAPRTATDFPAQTFNPAFLDTSSEMYQDLHMSTTMDALGIDLSRSFTSVLSDAFVESLPYLLLIVAIGLTGWYQQRQIQGRNPEAQANPQMKMVSRVMLIFLPIISLGFQGGLLIYFVTSNLIRVGQQAFITYRIYRPSADDPIEVAYSVDDDDDDDEQPSESADTSQETTKPQGGLAGLLGGGQQSPVNHGRRPTSSPPKRKPKPKPKSSSSSDNGRESKGPRSGSSGRTTPKGEQSHPSNRSKKKKKRK